MKNIKPAEKLTTLEIIATILFFAAVPLITAVNRIPEPIQRCLTQAWADTKLIARIIFFVLTLPFVYLYDRLTGNESWLPKVGS